MLNRNIDSIIYQSYLKLGEIAYELSTNSILGLDGTKNQKQLWNKVTYIDALLETVNDHVEVKNGAVYRILGITTQEMNVLLDKLVEASGIYNYPVAPFLPGSISNIYTGATAQGNPGNNGLSYYIAVGYAEDSSGTNYTTTPNINTTHIAIKTSNSPIPAIASSFIGLWTLIKGDPGTDGVDGTDGTNGANAYIYIRYATDSSGTGFSTSPSGKTFIAVLNSPVIIPSPIVGDFAGLWRQFVGSNGLAGTNGNTLIYGSGSPSSGVGVDGDAYIDTAAWVIYAPKTSGSWPSGVSLIGPPGTDGNDGLPGNDGLNGTDGINAYIYIAYASDSSGTGYYIAQSNDPLAAVGPFDPNKEWIGIITSATAIGDTISVTNFIGKWSRYKGSGDTWATFSTTSLTIATGNQLFIVEPGLSYTTGQYVVVSKDGDPSNRMEGVCINYNSVTGQMSLDVTDIFGSGTFAAWDCNLQAGLITPPANTYAGASPTNITVGGLAAGTSIAGLTYDAIIEAMTQFYYPPTFSAFAITGETTPVEVGYTLSGSKTFTWSTTNSTNVNAGIAGSLKIRDITTSTDLIDSLVNDGTESSVAIGTVTSAVQGSHTWRISGVDTHTNPFSRDFVMNWYWRKHWGTSANATLSSAQILALTSNSLSNTNGGTYSFAAGNYKFFVWDDSLGSPTAGTGFKDTATNLAVDMATSADDAAYSNIQNGWSYALVSVTNAQGITSNKRVYRTRNTLGGSINILVS